jgi:hypothetical protein
MLVRKYTPQQICHALKLCPHHESTSLGAQHWEQYCFVCEFVTQIIEGYLKDDKEVAEIRLLLDSVCSLLPIKFSDQCIDFVNNYLQLAIQWILRNEPPKALCHQIGFCRRGDKINAVQKFRVN